MININFRKYIQLICYYLIPAFLLILMIYNIVLENNVYDEMVELGEIAFKLVLGILIVKPLFILFPKIKLFRFLIKFRRELGVLSFWFAMIHVFYLLYYLDLYSFNGLKQLFDITDLFLFTGFLSFIGMFILGITSNTLSVIKLKGNWKKLQMLVYPTFALLVIHKAEAEKEFGPYVLLVVYIILKMLEYRKVKISNKVKE